MLLHDTSPLRPDEGILAWGKMAGTAKAKDPKVVDATIGVLKKGGKTQYLPSYKKKLAEVVLRENTHDYPGIFGKLGEPENEEAVLSLAFGVSNVPAFKMLNRRLDIGPALGGTHAIVLAFKLASAQKILVGTPYWPNYKTLATYTNRELFTFELFKREGEGYALHLDSLKEAAEKLIETEPFLTLLLNDPGANPTGLSMNPEQYLSLSKYLNELTDRGVQVQVILDPAYAAYDPRGLEKATEDSLLLLLKNAPAVRVFCAWSATKQYLEYNDRTGALMLWQGEGEDWKDDSGAPVRNHIAGSIRGTISQPPSRGQITLLELFKEGKLKDLDAERAAHAVVLSERGALSIQLAKEAGLEVVCTPEGKHPGGFMTFLPMKNPEAMAFKLSEKGVYTAPIDEDGLRIAVSGVDLEEIPRIFETIQNVQSN